MATAALSWVLWEGGDNLPAKKQYAVPVLHSRRVRPIDRARARRLMDLHRAHADAGQVDAALETAISAVVMDCTNAKIRLALAGAYHAAGLFLPALSWAMGLGENPQAAYLTGLVYYDMNRYAKAAESFGLALRLSPGFLDAHIRKASALFADGHSSKALYELGLVLKQEPGNTWARTVRAKAWLEEGKPGAALDDMHAIAEYEKTPVHALLHARCAVAAGLDQDSVDEIFESYLRLFPNHAQLRLNFAQYLSSRKDMDPPALLRSKNELESILGMERLPRNIEAQACFLLAELETESHQEQSLVLFQRGLDMVPDHPGGLSGLGALYLRQARADRAMPWLLRSIMSDPERSGTIELLAEALSGLLDEDAAARWMGLLFSGIPSQAPLLMARVLAHVRDMGRADSYMDVRRSAHRMKNKVAVLASRVRTGIDIQTTIGQLDELYEHWNRFLNSLGSCPGSMVPLAVKDIVYKAARQVATDDMRCVFRLQPDLPLLKGDEQQLVDALANVISNAMQASDDDSPVHIVARSSDEGDFVQISVIDHGRGLSADAIGKVFMPGYTTRDKGSGIGLSVTRKVVLAHGGKVSVSSAPGGLTTFSLRLPSVVLSGTPSLMAVGDLMGK